MKSRPLTNLTRKAVPFVWGPDEQNAFDNIRTILTSAPVLRHYDPSLPTEIRTDASAFAIGAVLVQEEPPGTKRPVAYLSRKLSDCERNYSVSEREMLAIQYACVSWRHFLLGISFTFITDHAALKGINNSKDPYGRLARAAMILSEFNFKIIHKAGTNLKDADALSRNVEGADPAQAEGRKTDLRVLIARVVPSADDRIDIDETSVATEQRADPTLTPLIDLLLGQTTDPQPRLLKESRRYVLTDGKLYRRHYARGTNVFLLVIPKTMQQQIMYQFHDTTFGGGHLGQTKTLARITERYYWEGMAEIIREYVRTCHNCQSRKTPRPISIPTVPFTKISMDIPR